MPTCFLCHQIFPDLAKIWIHFRLQHMLHANSDYRCGELDCHRFFNTIKSYRRHWQVDHNENPNKVFTETASNSALVVDISSCSASANRQNLCTDTDVRPEIHSPIQPGKIFDNEITRFNFQQTARDGALRTVMKFYDYPNFPRSHVQLVVDSTKSFLEEGPLNILGTKVLGRLQDLGESFEKMSEISSMFASLEQTFNELKTEHLRFKALIGAGHFIMPEDIVIGHRFERVQPTTDRHRRMTTVEVKAKFLPLRKVLRKVFEMSNVYEAVMAYKLKLESETEVQSNFIQGSLWQDKAKGYEGKQVLPLFLFFDDYETGNPLGSHAGVNKLGGVYVSVPCYPPEYQSVLSSIYIAMLFYTNDKKEFGNAAVFQKLIAELRFLQDEGIEVDLAQGRRKFFFKLGLIIEDNLGLHSILGFIESFRGNYACRFCKMSKDERASCCIEQGSSLRTSENYEHDLKMGFSSLTGIKEECVFHTLPDFHVTENFAVDIMHDLFEGVCVFDMVEIIRNFTEVERFFSLNELNHRITCFDYGPIETGNMPCEISADHLKRNHISMSAAEMLTFVRLFGLMVGDLVPVDNPIWQFYLLIRQIISLVTSKAIQVECTILLETLIQEHNNSYIQLFQKNLKPKNHHLVHYPRIMRASGPLIHLWCMRFESKHRESKLAAAATTSRKNIGTTLAIKHQLQLAYQFNSNIGFQDVLELGPEDYATFTDLPILITGCMPSSLTVPVYFSKWVKKLGTKYKAGMVICTGDDNDGLPCFGVIVYIAVDSANDVSFLFRELDVLGFHNHFYAYEVHLTNSPCKVIKFENLLNPMPSNIIKEHGARFVSLRCWL